MATLSAPFTESTTVRDITSLTSAEHNYYIEPAIEASSSSLRIEVDDVGTVTVFVKRRESLESTWFVPTVMALKNLPWNVDDWASEGSKRTEGGAVSKILSLLLTILDDRSPPPFIVATWEGGIQAEWHLGHIDFEIESTPSGTLEYLYHGPEGESEARISEHDLGQVRHLAQTLVASSPGQLRLVP